MTILVTGGAGFIASHTNVELLQEGYDVIVMDNLCNSSKESLARVEQITGKKIKFYETDMRDIEGLETVFAENSIDVIIHFAGLKAVGESCEKPYEYYDNNITGTLNIIRMMKKYDVKKIVFSSSATVYGEPEVVPITEDSPVGGVTNPYGRTKFMLEEILRDIQKADNSFDVALLRYFNPIGAHESGLIGEAPNGIPNNLLPYVAKVAAGVLEKVNVFGDDYPTPDGTGVRDYIHVVDLAKGHVSAVKKLMENPGLVIYNLGTGIGYSVLDIIKNFEKACGKTIPYVIAPRRAGDIPTCYSDPSKAEKELGWKAQYGIDKMCEDAWRWQSMNPNGYDS
ncbi:MAG: UDP-glucose 4-epimerase GalE [Bacteroidales bacterium]|nr:UDP-glucose 4-epimerase GalE [Clostridium sp.]MCM1202942.1 UDP-glucose 4-epimerase GalE [Bacteroidales bacterium]